MFNKISMKKDYKFYTTVFIASLFLMTSIISIGYGALNQNLNIAGQLNYEKLKVKAENVSYDNTTSGTSSTTVQEAIDELYSNSNIQTFLIYYVDNDIFYPHSFKSGLTWRNFINSNYNSGVFHIDTSGDYGDHSNHVEYQVWGWLRTTKTDASTTNFVTLSSTIQPTTYYVYHDECCFDPETLVTIDFEGHTKKIKDFEVGDKIVIENVKTGKKQITTVVKDASIHPVTIEMTDITLEDGTVIKFNSYHPIYTTEGYKSVTNYNGYETLKEGDYTIDFNGKKKKITKVKTYAKRPSQATYNLLIKGVKEEFLEEEYAYYANGILVHTGIAEYDDEEYYRKTHKDRCKYQELYKDFNYDKATDEEVIDFLVDLYFKDAEAEKEYIKYYINADQYFRYTEFAREVKDRIKNTDTSKLNKYSKYDKNKLIESK